MDLPKRKHMRLPDYDYSGNGYYFVTICTHNMQKIFWKDATPVGATCGRPQYELSPYGDIVNAEIQKIATHYNGMVRVDKYVIMPNHIHMILILENVCHENGRPQVAPTISRVVQQWKGSISKQLGVSIWQKSFHDHIIRNQAAYEEIWQYIDTNPLKWELDCYHTP